MDRRDKSAHQQQSTEGARTGEKFDQALPRSSKGRHQRQRMIGDALLPQLGKVRAKTKCDELVTD